MVINLQIEQLLLEDIDLSYGERLRLQAMVAAELSQLLTAKGLPPHLQNGGTIHNLPAHINILENPNPTQMGRQIAQSIYQGINGNVP
jgi:hypothetical protein